MRTDRRSPEAAEYRKLYKTKRWASIRADQLAKVPTCEMCELSGRVVPAVVCDHVRPHKGDEGAFFRGPFQSLCKNHHDKAKQADEFRGYSLACGADGWPTDPSHPTNAWAGQGGQGF